MIFEENCIIGIEYGSFNEADLLMDIASTERNIVFPSWCSEADKFILDRQVECCKPEQYKGLDTEEVLIWYSPLNKSELDMIVEKSGIAYDVGIIEKGESVSDSGTYLEFHEHLQHEGKERRCLFFNGKQADRIYDRAMKYLKKRRPEK